MKRRSLRLIGSLALAFALPLSSFAKSYSSGGGHSYSSHSSSSRSSSSGGGHSFSSGSSRSSSASSRSSGSSYGSSRSSGGSSSKSFSSGSGKSYSSGSSAPGNRKGYSSGKSYGAGLGSSSKSKDSSSSSSSGFSFDQPAARARKEQASKSDFARYKDSQTPPPLPRASGNDYSGTSSRPVTTYSRPIYTPDYTVIRTRPSRINIYFGNYSYRPWVYYHDPYSSLFWWWLLDRSIDDQAYWAYHHRYDMDPARYDALMASNQQLQARVSQLEAQQVTRDPSYTPTDLGTNQDLMYSDQYVNQGYQSYQNRSTNVGRAAFWVFGVPAALGFSVFFVWFVFFKRW